MKIFLSSWADKEFTADPDLEKSIRTALEMDDPAFELCHVLDCYTSDLDYCVDVVIREDDDAVLFEDEL